MGIGDALAFAFTPLAKAWNWRLTMVAGQPVLAGKAELMAEAEFKSMQRNVMSDKAHNIVNTRPLKGSGTVESEERARKIEEERQFEDAKDKLKEAENESQKGSITDELNQLVEMKEKGLLTDQQFEDAKDKLLA